MSRRRSDDGRRMQVMAESVGLAAKSARDAITETMLDPVRRPPGHPPQEPIIIKIPPRPPAAPEIDRSDDEEEEEAEIRRPPEIVPELPPPPRPEELRSKDSCFRTRPAVSRRAGARCGSLRLGRSAGLLRLSEPAPPGAGRLAWSRPRARLDERGAVPAGAASAGHTELGG
jgi:hypothetical protein